jgi:GT2 family glycosyltransferase
MVASRLTVGITTRNRPQALPGCLESLARIDHLLDEVIVFDDGSEPAVEVSVESTLPVRIIRDVSSPGLIVGRNHLVREARTDLVLLLDDDARVLDASSIERALEIMGRDDRVGAVAFAQAEADGRPWPVTMQPSRATRPSVIPSFIGFAHLLRRELFLRLGGYREEFIFYGEEKDFCLRLLDAGYLTVYLPDALVSHIPDASGRSRQRYLRFLVRNDCLNAFYNDPWPRVLWTLPVRYLLYFRMRRGWRIPDPWGWLWIARDVLAYARRTRDQRRPVSRASIRLWTELKRAPRPYA